MRKLISVTTLLLLSLGLSACSIDGEITDQTIKIRKSMLGQQRGLAAASQQNVIVGGGYKVSSSVDSMSGIYTTFGDGTQVYTSVQGTIAAESYTEIRQ